MLLLIILYVSIGQSQAMVEVSRGGVRPYGKAAAQRHRKLHGS